MSIGKTIHEVESHLNIKLPQDYCDFMFAKGTVSDFLGKDFIEIFPVCDITARSEVADFQSRFPKSLVIGGDGSRELLTYDYRQNPPTLVLLDVSAEDWSSAIYQASSPEELLKEFPERGWKFQ